MKISNWFSPIVFAVALASTSQAYADNTASAASPVDTAYNAYIREANTLEKTLELLREPIENPETASVWSTQETLKHIELLIAYQKAHHDLALGKYLAEAAANRTAQ